MAEIIELTPEEEARNKWKSVLLGSTQVVVEPEIVIEATDEEPEVDAVVTEIEDSPEATLARLFKSMSAASTENA